MEDEVDAERRSAAGRSGVAQLLSMMVTMPCALASAASAPTSWASITQLVGLSM